MARRARGGAFVVLTVLCSLPVLPLQACLVPVMFVFGDSLVDVGNNNHLPGVNDSCKANYPPYGVDFPGGQTPTGRFSNGYNLADHLARLLGFEESPPSYNSLISKGGVEFAFDRVTSKGGVNFASGGSGLQSATGGIGVCGGQVISMAEQVGKFKSLVQTWERSRNRTLAAAAADGVSKSLVFISVGSNDLFEYSDFYADPRNANVPRNDTDFLQRLIGLYAGYVKDLYAAGARKLSVVSPSLVGCCPFQRKVANDSKVDMDPAGCLSTANRLSMLLYPMLSSMLQSLSHSELPRMSYSLGDAIGMAQALLGQIGKPGNNFTAPPFQPCCGDGVFGETGCNSTVHLCPDRSRFSFWDRYHPTEAVSAATAAQLFGDNGTFVHPINVHQLVASTSPLPS